MNNYLKSEKVTSYFKSVTRDILPLVHHERLTFGDKS